MFMKIFYSILLLLIFMSVMIGMKLEEKNRLRLQVIDMFKHGFGSYMVLNYSFQLNFVAVFFFIIEICLSS